MKRLVTGILAHVDSGKTTLSEALLYRAGALRTLGRVDHGDAFLDTDPLERERGITIFSKQAILRGKDAEITLLDTPGHVDFSPEAERTLSVLDCAILVVSGTDGVQSHTETLWSLLEKYRVPVFLFINKMDMPGADRDGVMEELRAKLSENCVDFGAPEGGEFFERLALCDEELMERVVETGRADAGEIAGAVSRRLLFPCWFGSALKADGVDELLCGLETYGPFPRYGAKFGARVFKISEDEQGNRLTHLKITGGVLHVRDQLSGGGEEHPWSEKVSQIRVYSGSKFQTPEMVEAGTVCAVAGLNATYPGEGLGAEPDGRKPLLEPVLTYRVELPAGTDVHGALTRLRRLEQEEPELHVVWNETVQEIHVQLMGQVQLEVLRRRLLERFGLDVTFGQGSILYKETVAEPVEGIGHYEPLRHYAEVHLLMEPGERGSGVRLCSDCREDDLDRVWQKLIMTHLAEKAHVGVLTGSPVTDLKITLVAGRASVKHTEGGDFRQATYRAVRQGLRSAKSILLEPWYSFRLTVPQECVGRAMSDLQRMGAEFGLPEQTEGRAALSGQAPVSEIRDYQSDVTSYTRGGGRLSLVPAGYRPCHNAEEVVASIGYDCDSDVENTADSVFCTHGAGETVKWNEVPARAHVDSGLRLDGEEEPETVQRQASAYRKMLADDAELMAIFERTYGPIRRDPRTAFQSAPRAASQPKPAKGKPLPEGPEYLLVDGYNIIHAWDDLRALAAESLDAARSKLINTLCNYQGFRRSKLIVVFDAYKVKGNPGAVEQYHNITIVYTKEAETADMYIEKATNDLGKDHRVRVATSDGLEQLIILGHGALRLSASAFRAEVEQTEKEIRAYLT